jgi:hypothetical protein
VRLLHSNCKFKIGAAASAHRKLVPRSRARATNLKHRLTRGETAFERQTLGEVGPGFRARSPECCEKGVVQANAIDKVPNSYMKPEISTTSVLGEKIEVDFDYFSSPGDRKNILMK